MDLQLIELFTKAGGAAAVSVLCIYGIAKLYKDMMDKAEQNRLYGIKRDEELTKCFNNTVVILEGINTTLRDNNATMRDINTRLSIIERKVD